MLLARCFRAELACRRPHDMVPDCPEQDLVLAVLERAFEDSIGPDGVNVGFCHHDRGRKRGRVKLMVDAKADALYLFNSHRLDTFAKALEIPPEEIREVREMCLAPDYRSKVKAFRAPAHLRTAAAFV